MGRLLLVVLGLLLAAGGCGVRTPEPDRTGKAPRAISLGYALLYEMVGTQRFADEILLFKFESDEVERVIDRTAAHASDIKRELEELARDYPAVRLDPEVLPEVHLNMLRSLIREQLKEVLSRSGKEFERTLLFVVVGLLQQERHLARVMVEAETDARRRRFWEETQRRFDADYRQVIALLERRYFR